MSSNQTRIGKVLPSVLFSGKIVNIAERQLSLPVVKSIDNGVPINGLKFIEPDEESMDESISEPYMESFIKYKDDFVNPNIQYEPLLSLKTKRYTVYPVQYHSIWNNYKDQLRINWVVGEVDLSKDIDHWETKLSDNDRTFISYVLAFFASADGIVNCNIQENLVNKIMAKESQCALGKQYEMENVHGEMYSLMLDTFVKDLNIKNKLIDSFKTMPSIKKKAQWCERWINNNKTIAHSFIAFAIVEGVFFSGSFASIFWLKTRPGNIMPGLIKSNRFIARDEAKHFELTREHYKLLNNKLKQSVVYEILDEAVDIEIEFINESLPCKLLGMNSDLMIQYIQYVADRMLIEFGYEKLYNKTNPFEFMNKIDMYVKANFFEERNDSYSDSKI